MIIFSPIKSKAPIFLGLVILFCLALEVLCFVGWVQTGHKWIFIPMMIFCSAGVIIFLTFWGWYPSMRYIVSGDQLILSCGSLKSEISLDSITRIDQKNLAYDVTSTGFKFPGYCLFKVKYADEGWVRMYSRSILKDIILIEAAGGKYGITPEDKVGFIKALERKIK